MFYLVFFIDEMKQQYLGASFKIYNFQIKKINTQK